MKPICKISIDGQAVKVVTKNLVSATMTLNSGQTPDKIDIVLADPLAQLPRPRAKAKVMATFGYENGPQAQFGPFFVDSYSGGFAEDEGENLTISATSIDFNSKAKSRASKTHKDTTLGDIIQKEASEAGFSAHVDSDLSSFPIEIYNRDGRSFYQMIAELADEFDAIEKYENKKVLFLSRTGGVNIAGAAMAVKLDRHSLKSWSWTRNFKADYKGVKATSQNYETGKKEIKTAELDEGDSFYEIRKLFPNSGRAAKAAQSKAKQLKRAKRQIEFELMQGNPALIALMDVTLSGLSEEANRTWVTKTATHQFNAADEGYRTTATAENKA
jgi:phage protein D